MLLKLNHRIKERIVNVKVEHFFKRNLYSEISKKFLNDE